jgi:tetratricopeptide (TPR) repeat protein
MNRALAALLASSISLAPVVVPSPVQAAARLEPSPEELYEQGRKAYRLGKFKEAIEAWERSFAASDNSLLLYNIALAYRELYGITSDVEDLKRARAVLDNFIRVAETDPALKSEIGDAQTRIAEIDAELAAALARRAAEKPVLTENKDSGPSAAELARARKLRLGGAISMGVGGALIITGISLGAFFSIKGREYSNLVKQNKQRATDILSPELEPAEINGCLSTGTANQAESLAKQIDALPPGDPAADDLLEMLDECAPAIDPLAAVSTYRRNGTQANTNAIISFAVIGGVGLVGIITGAVLFSQGNRLRTKRVADLQLSPVIGGRSMTGLSLTGRF